MSKPGTNAHFSTYPNRQSGVAILLFILFLVLGASSLLVSKLDKAAARYYRDDVTMKSLVKAKEALIGYAVSYPDFPSSAPTGNPGTTVPEAGPGYLPCPDLSFPPNGSPNSCGPDAIGRLPWEFLDIEDIRDSSGEQLWYALSANFRNRGGVGSRHFPMNSETQGQLNVDGASDVVAVIIAPGEPIVGQSTRPSNTAADYLEGDNASVGDQSFASDGNDNLLVITRQELMAAVEKRVLGEVSQVLKQYRNSFGGGNSYPWLSPFVNPRLYATSATSFENSSTITGTTSAGSSGNSLEDSTKDFGVLDVRDGDIVSYRQSINDVRLGVVNVNAASGANTLTVRNFLDQYPVNFAPGNEYWIARFSGEIQNPLPTTAQQGLLPYHTLNEGFITRFRNNWTINGATVAACSQLDDTPGIDEGQAHIDDLIGVVESGSVLVNAPNGGCVWGGEPVVDCTGEEINPFNLAPVPLPGLVTRCPTSTLTPPVTVAQITQRRFVFRLKYIGNSSVISVNGSKTRDVTAVLPQPGAEIEVTVQDLDSSDRLVGEAQLILSPSATGNITTSGIHYDLAELGGIVSSAVSSATSTTIKDSPKDFVAREVRPGQWIENLSISGARGRISAVTTDTITISRIGSPSISFTSGDQYRVYNELPKWFVYNNWHHLTLVAESAENIPGGSGTCTTGTNCLGITDSTGTIPGSNDDKQAIVMAAGGQLADTTLAQDRVNGGAISDYFEGDNNNGNNLFQRNDFTPGLNTFNDQLKRIAPCPSPNEINNCF